MLFCCGQAIEIVKRLAGVVVLFDRVLGAVLLWLFAMFHVKWWFLKANCAGI